ncbi:uncharacterized protein GLRG_04849 [Colletotrichum graminicola M1.001]|uniref:Uncharacterized protein n=1 Tax=Colletotrichum graminicola (strain M1.001 / M2 / FGSC 10212) TaxID=645133 RepID=E3QGA9_COLGM|nr:uncharacterized protein GLRG_04849 [Colletotrichum graminicola M1.001]EFQ29705.1 hypothetical protein GLRG_04849 [Colletotrichum graminicola M1.001]
MPGDNSRPEEKEEKDHGHPRLPRLADISTLSTFLFRGDTWEAIVNVVNVVTEQNRTEQSRDWEKEEGAIQSTYP